VLGVSERFACRVTRQHRATQRHEPDSATPDDPDAALRQWLRAYAKDHPRRGFRPAYHDARAEGRTVNHKKIQRLWRDEGLRVPQRRRRKRHRTSTAPPTVIADGPNRVWAVDFQFDVTTDARLDDRRGALCRDPPGVAPSASGTGQCRRSLRPREISEEVEDERVGFVRRFQRDEVRGVRGFDVTGVR
jgi:hypothetical protein